MEQERPRASSSRSHDDPALLASHAIPHSASEPARPSSISSGINGADSVHSPPAIPEADAQAFSSLKPTGSSETPAYTAAAAARGRSTDDTGAFSDFDPNRRPSIPSPATVIKSLPEVAGAPARTVEAIKSKLKSPSTGRKSKSEISDSIGQLERDLRHNGDAPGNLDAKRGSSDGRSGSFSSLFGRKKKGGAASKLMQRGPAPEPHIEEEQQDTGRRSEEEEEDDETVQQRIREQQKRLEDLDEAQTEGLLRTQQEAGIEPIKSPETHTKPSRLVGLPLFGSGHGKDGHKDGEASSRRSSFHRSQGDAETDEGRGRSEGVRRTKSEKHSSGKASDRNAARSASASRTGSGRSKSRPRNTGALSPPRRNSTTNWTSKLRTKIPIKEFPLQGAGRESEFNQECPLWARQPYKYMYFSYFGLSVGCYHLPRWAVSSILPSHRGRPDWSWKKATMVKLFRHGTKLTFRTRTSLGRDLQKEVPHSKTVRCKFTWVPPVGDGDVRGELRRAMIMQKVHPQRTCGFWYGDVAELAKQKARKQQQRGRMLRALSNTSRDEAARQASVTSTRQGTPANEDGLALQESEATLTSQISDASSRAEANGGVGRPAQPGEKVLYHLHGGAYWIGTAHEKDVTAAVNTESLRYMAEIYKAKEKASGPTTEFSGKLLRSFSLDYRLCVPGRPRAGSYPAALLDALSGYLYLVRDLGFDPENIIVAGDSAGGNLGLALCRYLRDEGKDIAPQPGALLLMSPWVDVSRSHSGPTGAPNLDSTVYLNRDSDIISSLIDFRNTAVSAFLGDLPARETYRNPYISPVSLQLPLERGGKAPHYGFHGFPKKIYITTGSAEISYDQHLTLAHRLASGTRKGRPVYAGDRLSAGCNAREMAERRDRPRPRNLLDAEQDSVAVTPAGEIPGMDLTPAKPAEKPQQYATQVVDGEPRTRPEYTSHDTTLLGERESSSSDNRHHRMHASPPPEPQEREDREVVLDEVKDAVHDYLLFKWFEPERSSTWRRIAQWIDEV
ncbi:Alpha/beta hydrolase fold-3 [Kalmanozyma brasiliensis GHG001]|uniref:Alpha/beta hydrolase fold-3 domain-containing protein n=1 Tax=Kalmanozyma brasiliensis (strain GHG001) TaxID=1365824 RepID=V5EWX6_KALBG|nr:Alpha/beta hydrolase fold-3 [Kalmanozyma brasiliensis GHG001]EST10130.1 Alpha/beta hydrolase fold-3 [Kalmanozyma brasiliensis GHG001]